MSAGTNDPQMAPISADDGMPTLPIVSGVLTINPADPEVQWILGRTCLTCSPIAHCFQRAGYPIPKHAEEETAHIKLWMLARYLEHGEGWRRLADIEIRMLNDLRQSAQSADSTGEPHAH